MLLQCPPNSSPNSPNLREGRRPTLRSESGLSSTRFHLNWNLTPFYISGCHCYQPKCVNIGPSFGKCKPAPKEVVSPNAFHPSSTLALNPLNTIPFPLHLPPLLPLYEIAVFRSHLKRLASWHNAWPEVSYQEEEAALVSSTIISIFTITLVTTRCSAPTPAECLIPLLDWSNGSTYAST